MSFTKGFCELCLPRLMGLQKLIFVEDLIKLGSLGYHFKKKKNALSLCSLPQLPVSIRSRTHALFSRDARVLSGHTLIHVVKVTMALVQKTGLFRAGQPGATGLHTEAVTGKDASHPHRQTIEMEMFPPSKDLLKRVSSLHLLDGYFRG